MKPTNDVYEDKPIGLKAKILREVGDQLSAVAGSPPCWFFTWYEPSLPSEIIEDMVE